MPASGRSSSMVRTSGSARQALTLAGRRRRRSGVQLSPGPPSTLKAKGTSSESVLEQESRDLRRIPDSSRCRVQLLSPVPPGIVPPVPCPPRSLPPAPAPSPRSRKVPQPGGSHPPKAPAHLLSSTSACEGASSGVFKHPDSDAPGVFAGALSESDVPIPVDDGFSASRASTGSQARRAR